ncbi:metallophosphoesterase [uncultured Shimia sp.]|uniref:metallophosphoesterase n=1 Tax=uncultured Shimia sp. TaxID=573152 RepID=UPI00261DE23F|nr:metallophosphoesterase [uncultured Shimia sp.]
MKNWYTADCHFGHGNVIKFCGRPFETVDEMDAAIIENMWKVVGPEDRLFILGDFAFGARTKERAFLEHMFAQLPGAERHLVVGNHDQKQTLELPWDTVSQVSEVRDGPHQQRNTLCHYPLITWNHARRGALQMFGHVHGNWLGSRNSVNVGVDVWDFAPVDFDAVQRRASTLPPNKHWHDVEPGADLE